MKQNSITTAAFLLLWGTLFSTTSCIHSDEYYGTGNAPALLNTVEIEAEQVQTVSIKYRDGHPSLENSTLEIPVSLRRENDKPLTVSLVRNDKRLEELYTGSRYQTVTFPDGIIDVSPVTIAPGERSAIIRISLTNEERLTNDAGYLAAYDLNVVGDEAVTSFGVQTLFIVGEPFRSSNKANLSINGKTVSMEANVMAGWNPKALSPDKMDFTVKLNSALDRDVTLILEPDEVFTNVLYPDMDGDFKKFPEGTVKSIEIRIPRGETEVKQTLDIENTFLLDEAPGYMVVYRLREQLSDRNIVSSGDKAFFTLKVKKTNSAFATEFELGPWDEKTGGFTVKLNDSDVPESTLTDGRKEPSSPASEIKIGKGGRITILFPSINSHYLVLYGNLKESGVESFKVALTQDEGNTWYPGGVVDKIPATGELKVGISSGDNFSLYNNGYMLYDFKGKEKTAKIYEVEAYTYW